MDSRTAADVPAQSIPPTATLFDIAHIFLTRSYRKLPVVDGDGHVVGQVSRRDMLVAIESRRDNPRLYGVKDQCPTDDMSVDSAMRLARSRRQQRRRSGFLVLQRRPGP